MLSNPLRAHRTFRPFSDTSAVFMADPSSKHMQAVALGADTHQGKLAPKSLSDTVILENLHGQGANLLGRSPMLSLRQAGLGLE